MKVYSKSILLLLLLQPGMLCAEFSCSSFYQQAQAAGMKTLDMMNYQGVTNAASKKEAAAGEAKINVAVQSNLAAKKKMVPSLASSGNGCYLDRRFKQGSGPIYNRGKDFAGCRLYEIFGTNPSQPGLDFTDANMAFAIFRRDQGYTNYPFDYATLNNTCLVGAWLQDATFTGATIKNSSFEGTDCRNSDFGGAKYLGIYSLKNAKVQGCNFSAPDNKGVPAGFRISLLNEVADKDLSGVSLTNLDFQKYEISFDGFLLKGANFSNSILTKDCAKAQKDMSGIKLVQATLPANSDFTGFIFKGADLSGFKASGAVFARASFDEATLTDTSIAGLNCSGASFKKTKLGGVVASKTNLSKAVFDNTGGQRYGLSKGKLDGANCTGAAFKRVNLEGVDATGADFSGALFSDVLTQGMVAVGANFTGARGVTQQFLSGVQSKDLSGAILSGLSLTGFDFSNFNLTKAHFASTANAKTNMAKVNLTGAQAAGINLAGVVNLQTAVLLKVKDKDLSGANLSGLDLSHLDFSGFNLTGAVISHAHCEGTKFVGATLDNLVAEGIDADGADFSNTTLKGVNLSGASCKKALFENGTLSNVDLTNADFTGAKVKGLAIQGTLKMDGIKGAAYTFSMLAKLSAMKAAGIELKKLLVRNDTPYVLTVDLAYMHAVEVSQSPLDLILDAVSLFDPLVEIAIDVYHLVEKPDVLNALTLGVGTFGIATEVESASTALTIHDIASGLVQEQDFGGLSRGVFDTSKLIHSSGIVVYPGQVAPLMWVSSLKGVKMTLEGTRIRALDIDAAGNIAVVGLMGNGGFTPSQGSNNTVVGLRVVKEQHDANMIAGYEDVYSYDAKNSGRLGVQAYSLARKTNKYYPGFGAQSFDANHFKMYSGDMCGAHETDDKDARYTSCWWVQNYHGNCTSQCVKCESREGGGCWDDGGRLCLKNKSNYFVTIDFATWKNMGDGSLRPTLVYPGVMGPKSGDIFTLIPKIPMCPDPTHDNADYAKYWGESAIRGFTVETNASGKKSIAYHGRRPFGPNSFEGGISYIEDECFNVPAGSCYECGGNSRYRYCAPKTTKPSPAATTAA